MKKSFIFVLAAIGVGRGGHFVISVLGAVQESSGRIPHDITVSYSLFGAGACCIMERAVEET